MIRPALVLVLLATATATAASAAGPVDPDWPCIQRRQPQLSLAQVWSGPVPDAAAAELVQSEAVQGLARQIALRRVPLDRAEAMIGAFARDHGGPELTALFLATFEHIQKMRDRVMAGITRYAHKQKALETRIVDERHAFEQLSAAEPKDFDAIDKAEASVDWSTRIFQDRQQSLTYVCETPVILEQRAFALGRAIAGHLPR